MLSTACGDADGKWVDGTWRGAQEKEERRVMAEHFSELPPPHRAKPGQM